MASNNQMHNFTTLIKRLEAATSRLEDMAATFDGPTPTTTAIAAPSQEPAPQATPKPTLPKAPTPESLPRAIEAWDNIINREVKDFLEISHQIGGPVAAQARAVGHAFDAERTFLLVSTKAKKPDPQPAELLTELHKASDEINNIRESNRASPMFTQLSAVAEGTVSMGWFFNPRPADFVTDTLGAVQFYGNRVLKEYKDKDITQVEYIQAYYRVFKGIIAFLKEFYPRGMTWNPDGMDALEALKQVQSSSGAASTASEILTPVSGGAPPPPPPPPPPPAPAPAPAASSTPDMGAVFDQLNQGEAITSGLRKVDKSEMTHKNPSLRSSSLVPSSTSGPTARPKSPAPSKKPKPESLRAKKLPRKHLDGSKWFIEHYENTQDVIEISAEITHSILISRCHKAIIKVNNKANAIQIDNCSGLSIIVDSLVSSIEVIKAQKFALQIDGSVPTVVMDQVDGATVYLNQLSLETELFTSKSTAINVVLPPKGDEDDKECPIPEQVRSYIKDGQLVSEIVDHAG